MDSEKSIFGNVGRFFSGTLLSRISGLGRDVAMAAAFGADPSIAAFMVALRLSHLLRRLLGEGALHAAFVPQFEELRQKDPEKAGRFFWDLAVQLGWLLVGIILITELVAGGLIYSGILSQDTAEVVWLICLMFPSLFFICQFGLMAGLLYCENRYFLPGIAPVAYNLVWIGTVFWVWHTPVASAMQILAAGIILACALQWALTLPVGRSLMNRTGRSDPSELRRLVGAMGLGVIGVGAVQINSALDYLFARSADLSGPAYLWYAIRVQQLPIGLFGVALAGALLPPLSRAMKSGQLPQFCRFLEFALKRGTLFMVPFCVAFAVGGAASLNLLYGRGQFGETSLINTTWCLWGYSGGILPTLFVMVLAPAFYAQDRYRVPAIASCIAVFINIFLNSVFVFALGYGPAAVAAATSVSAWVNAAILAVVLAREVEGIRWLGVALEIGRISAGCIAAAAPVFALGYWIGDPTLHLMAGTPAVFVSGLTNQLAHYGLLAGAYGALLALSWLVLHRKNPPV